MFHPLGVFSADLHLQDCAWSKRPEIRGDAYRSWRQIVHYCRQNQLDLYLGGDIFDRRHPDPEAVREFHAGVNEMGHLGVFYVDGDHDHWPITSWPGITDSGVRCLHGQRMQIQMQPSVYITGLNWTPAANLQEALSRMERSDIVLMHEAWRELQGIGSVEGHIADFPFPCVLLTGDYHVPLELDVPLAGGGVVRVVSPGSTCMQDIAEAPEKSFIVFGWDEDHVAVRRHPLQTRQRYRIRGETEAAIVDEVRALVPAAYREACATLHAIQNCGNPLATLDDIKPLLRITYPDTLRNLQAAVTEVADTHFHLFWQPKSTMAETTIDYTGGNRHGAFNTLAAAVDTLLPGTTFAGACLQQLLRTTEPLPAVLTRMHQGFVGNANQSQ